MNRTHTERTVRNIAIATLAGLVLAGCASKPLMPYTTDSTPLVMVPAIQNNEQDKRGRFREIFCEVLETRKNSIPDYRNCDEALTRVGKEPDGTGNPVDLGPSQRNLTTFFVPGVGWDCFSEWLAMEDTIPGHIGQFGYNMVTLDAGGLSSSSTNAEMIRDAILALPQDGSQPDLVMMGYSKGAIDILQAIIDYPEIHHRIAAIVSAAGSIGGSPLANDASESQLNMLQHFPGARCKPDKEGALNSMRPDTRMAWLAENRLPDNIPYYSLVTFPDPERISSMLKGSYKKIARVDARNDSQVIFYDQFIPGSTLIAYMNADHWALAVPIARTHDIIGEILVDQNAFPREAMHEALLRFIEEDLQDKQN